MAKLYRKLRYPRIGNRRKEKIRAQIRRARNDDHQSIDDFITAALAVLGLEAIGYGVQEVTLPIPAQVFTIHNPTIDGNFNDESFDLDGEPEDEYNELINDLFEEYYFDDMDGGCSTDCDVFTEHDEKEL